MKAVKTLLAVALVAVFCLAIGSVNLQAIPTWLIKGKIIDATTKQPIEGVEISLRDKAMNRLYTMKTNKEGEYLYRLPLGHYHLKVKVKGYIPQEFPDIAHPPVGDERVENFEMQPGEGILASELTTEQRAEIEKQRAEYEANKDKIEEIKKVTGEVKKLFDEGIQLKDAGQYDAAIAKLQDALVKDPNQPNILGHLADCYYAKGSHDQAIETYNKALALSPSDANMLTNLGNAYVKKGMIPEAKTSFEKAIQADPAHSDVNYYNVGVVMVNAGKNDEAIDAFRKCLAANANYSAAHYQLGMCLINKGDYAGAVQSLETYLKLDPNGSYAAMAKQMLPELKKLVK